MSHTCADTYESARRLRAASVLLFFRGLLDRGLGLIPALRCLSGLAFRSLAGGLDFCGVIVSRSLGGFDGLRFGGQLRRSRGAFHRCFLAGRRLNPFGFRGPYHLAAFQAREIIIDRDADFFHRLGANAFDGFQVLFSGIDDSDAADFGRLERLFGEGDRILVILDDVDLFAAQFADDRLYAHAFHSNASADRVHVLVFGHDGDLGALTGLASDGADHNRAVINFGNFGLEQMLYQLRRGARNHNARSLGSLFDAHDHRAHPLAHGERLQARLLLASHARFGLADIENHIRTLDALHGRIHHFVHMADVLVVNGVALSLAYFLEDDLLGQLRCNASENSLGDLGNEQLAARFRVGIELASLVDRYLQVGILDLLGILDNRLDRVGVDLAALLVEHRAQIFLRLVVLASRDDDGVLDRANHDLRVDPLLAADPFDNVVKLACHKFRSQVSGLRSQVSGLRLQFSEFGAPETCDLTPE